MMAECQVLLYMCISFLLGTKHKYYFWNNNNNSNNEKEGGKGGRGGDRGTGGREEVKRNRGKN